MIELIHHKMRNINQNPTREHARARKSIKVLNYSVFFKKLVSRGLHCENSSKHGSVAVPGNYIPIHKETRTGFDVVDSCTSKAGGEPVSLLI